MISKGARIQSIAMQFGRVPCHADFARTFSGVRREFRVTTPEGVTNDFDARDRTGTLYEVKTGYEWLLNENLTSPWRARKPDVLNRFIDQADKQLLVATRCGRRLEWYFNNPSAAKAVAGRVEPPVRYRPFDCKQDSDNLW
jgi:hypothetical protein